MGQMSRDDSGQFLLLTGIIISVGMVILLIFINQSSMGGYSSSDSIMNFPKNDIRDIRADTINEATYLGTLQNNNPYSIYNNTTRGQHRSDMFNVSFNNYTRDMVNLTSLSGYAVDLSAVPSINNQTINNATVSIYFNDGETAYNETLIIDVGGT